MSEEKLVPKLRFTVYSNDWFLEKLDNVCQFVRDGTHGSFKDVEIGIPLLSAKDIFDGKININENSRLISIDDYNTIHKNYELTKGDILLTIVGTIGRTAMVNMDEKFTLQRSVAILRVNEQISYNFLYYYIQTSAFQNRLKSVVNQSAQGGVYLNSLKKLNIKLTADMNEQNKISSFLSIIDKKIELLEQKYQYYQEFKKYLMQQIFTQKLRFNFTDEWEKYLLGDISLIGKGFTPSTSNPSFWDGDLKWLSIADMNQGKYINQTTKKITSDGSKNKEPVKKGTLLMSFKLSIGKLGILTEDMYTNEAICNFKWKNKDVLTEYMYYYLSSINILKYGSQAAKGITLNNETLSTIPVLLPSLEEQKKIINILSDVDMKINMLENSINDTSKFKKGLLQQMFIVQLILSLLQNKKHI